MPNLASRTFTANGTFTAPAGVTQVTVVTKSAASPIVAYGPNILFLDPNGNSYGGGQNNQNNLGNGGGSLCSAPLITLGNFQFVQLAVGGSSNGTTGGSAYTMGLTSTGQVWAWGNNQNGNLGENSTTNRASPFQVVGGIQFAYIASGDSGASFGITPNGAAYAWGNNQFGMLGIGQNPGTTTAVSSPVAVVGGLTFQQILTSGNAIYGLTTSGALYSWGANTGGQLGLGDTNPRSSPVAVVGGLTFASLASFTSPNGVYNNNTDGNTILGITTSGAAYAWGSNKNGSLGANLIPTTNIARSSPVAVVGGLTFKQISVTCNGNGHQVLGLTTAGAAYGWGFNGAGQLGTNDTTPRSSPVAVVGGLTFSSIALLDNAQGTSVSFGITSAGAAYSWGSNYQGCMGTNVDPGVTTGTSSPVAVVGGISFQSITPSHNCQDGSSGTIPYGWSNSGTVYAWGSNGSVELAIGQNATATPMISSPVAVVNGVAFSQPLSSTYNIPVVPNTAYTVNIAQLTPTFGSFVIGRGLLSSIVVYFEQ